MAMRVPGLGSESENVSAICARAAV
uniref:Uncharacterized protein n=1 Tax=Arundo donax TaxID=35708 RepID=A0A0A9BYA5_ARUDO